MRKRVFIDNDGRVARTILASWDQLTLNTHNGDMYVDMPESSTNMENHYYCFLERAFKLIPVQPSKNHTFNYKMKVWMDLRSESHLRQDALNKIKAFYLNVENQGFEFCGNIFDSNIASQLRIQSIVFDESIDFIAQNNLIVRLNNDQFVQLKSALSSHIQNTRANYNAEKTRILNMSSRELMEFLDA